MKIKLPPISLRAQLVLSFLVIIMIILATGYGYYYTDSIKVSEKTSEEAILNQFKQIQYQVDTLVNATERISSLILIDGNIQNLLSENHSTRYEEVMYDKNFLDYFGKVTGSYDFIQSVLVCFENGKVIGVQGENATYSNLFTDKSLFPYFNSELYEKARGQYSRLVWGIGDSRLLYGDRLSAQDGGQNTNVFVAERALRGYGQILQQATLIINVKESYINNTYKFLAGLNQSNYFIVDGEDRIISHSDLSLIGTTEKLFHTDELKGQFGNFTLGKNSLKKKYFFYKMNNANWTIVSETPVAEYEKNARALTTKYAAIFAASVLVAFLLANIWMSRITKPLTMLTKAMSKIKRGKFGHTIQEGPKNEIKELISTFNSMSESIGELVENNRAAEEKKRIYEVEALRAQINPHFVYNTLNIIKWMAVIQKCSGISEAITALANIIGPLFKDKSPVCALSREIEYMENYIKIINIRFGEGMSVIYDFPERIMEYKILRFSLQPVIENAITHGYESVFDDSSIIIKAAEEDGALIITVEDNGKGMPAEKTEEINSMLERNADPLSYDSGIGLLNVNHRIKLHFGNEYGIRIRSVLDKGTTVYMKIPVIEST